MFKCLDMSKIHFVEGDTDSMYWAVSGSKTKTTNKDLNMLLKIILSIMRIFTSIHHQISIPLISLIQHLTALTAKLTQALPAMTRPLVAIVKWKE
jgi:hypothetical protein